MSTTPIIFKRDPSTYTVIGGEPRFSSSISNPLVGSVTLLVLGRVQKIFQQEALHHFSQLGFLEVLVVENHDSRLDVESLGRDLPSTRFILFHQSCSVGEQINRGIEEAKGELVFVIWDDISLPETPHLLKSIKYAKDHPQLCSVPEFRTRKGDEIPTLMTPGFFRKTLKVAPFTFSGEGDKTLYPYDFVGLYHREKFLGSGGYDHQMENPFWQKMDFGLRSHMWGESLVGIKGLRVQFQRDIPIENESPDLSYRLFFLKNLMVVFQKDMGVLYKRRFWSYFFRSGQSWFQARKDFKVVEEWTRAHQYRFKRDARGVVELWESLP